MNADILIHPVVVRSPDLIQRVEQRTGRRAMWAENGTHAELVQWPVKADHDYAIDYTGDGPEAA